MEDYSKFTTKFPACPHRCREREVSTCNSNELGGMDSTLPHLIELMGHLIGRLMDARRMLVCSHTNYSTVFDVASRKPAAMLCVCVVWPRIFDFERHARRINRFPPFRLR